MAFALARFIPATRGCGRPYTRLALPTRVLSVRTASCAVEKLGLAALAGLAASAAHREWYLHVSPVVQRLVTQFLVDDAFLSSYVPEMQRRLAARRAEVRRAFFSMHSSNRAEKRSALLNAGHTVSPVLLRCLLPWRTWECSAQA